MNESYPQSFIDRVNQFEKSFIRFLIEKYPISTQWDADGVLSTAWQQYIAPKLDMDICDDISFNEKKSELIVVNNARPFVENNQEALALCDGVEIFIVELLKQALNPCKFGCNCFDVTYTRTLMYYCLSKDTPGDSEKLDSLYWDEYHYKDVPRTLIPHISTPFIFMLLRYTYYHTIVRKMSADVEYRRRLGFNPRFDYAQVSKVDWGKYSPRKVCEQYAINHFGGGLRDIQHYDALHIKRQEDVPHGWYLTLVENEGRRLGQDYTYLQKHFNRRFVSSLMEWHKFYFDYLVECLHNCEEYKDYPIEKLVPPMKLEKIKPKLIDENRALTPLGKSYRRAIVAKIQECKTAADYGALLYKLQYDLGWFTKNRLSRNEYYLVMQQLGKVTFGSSGDFSNCNKGFYQADKEASKR